MRLIWALLSLSAACATPPWARTLELHPLASPTRASLRGVCAVSASIAWVSGSDGTCLRTLDGGASWLACGPEQTRGRDLRDVHAFDALSAVVMAVGSPALLLRTQDGGATWREVWRNDRPEAFLDGIAFTPGGDGLAFGDPIQGRFVAAHTSDAGATWEPVAGLPRPLAGEAAFAASGTCVATLADGTFLVGTGGGEVARVLRSEAPGMPWRAATTPVRAGTASRGVFSIAVDGSRAVAVGGDYQLPDVAFANVAVSDDAARSWHAPAGPGPRGFRSVVAFVPGTDGRMVVSAGPSGVDVSRDGGDSFAAASDTGFHALAFAADGTGFAVGALGRIARLTLTTTAP